MSQIQNKVLLLKEKETKTLIQKKNLKETQNLKRKEYLIQNKVKRIARTTLNQLTNLLNDSQQSKRN